METFRQIYENITTSSPTKFFTTSEALLIRQNPSYLKEYVQTKYGYKKFKKGFYTESQSGYKILKRLTVLHHLILHNPHLAFIAEDIQTQIYSSDKWFNEHILQPYYKFIKKFSSSIQNYQKCQALKTGGFKKDIFQILFYLVNIFRDLFKTVNKLSPLGRYFRQKAPLTIDSFVQLITYNSQNLYFYLRVIIQEIIQNSQKYLLNKNHEIIFKEILIKDVPEINQEMKKLFLDRYFYPYSKGYGVKLFNVQDKKTQLNRSGFILNSILNESLSQSDNNFKNNIEQNRQKDQLQDKKIIQIFTNIDFSQTIIKNPQSFIEKEIPLKQAQKQSQNTNYFKYKKKSINFGQEKVQQV